MKWSQEMVWQWYDNLPWLCGFNYLPRTAVNYTDMWLADSFNLPIIDQEFGWANRAGFNSVRVVLSFIVWQADPVGMKKRLDQFLAVAQRHGLTVMLCPLDDCGFSGEHPYLGPQKPPIPGVHNSQAAASPGRNIVMDKQQWPAVKDYITDIVQAFKIDERILIWDLYNEPGNNMIFKAEGELAFDPALEQYSYELLLKLFAWVREIAPSQPLTVGGWHLPPAWEEDHEQALHTHFIDVKAFELSDIITFHAYCQAERLQHIIEKLRVHQRPILCTEWMARHAGSYIEEQLPIFHAEQIGCYQWGLVAGKTQTYIPWPAVLEKMSPENGIGNTWFHDLLYEDGGYYSPSEIKLIQQLTDVHKKQN